MKKVMIILISILLIAAAIAVSLFIVPQVIGGEYSIGTMPNKLEYKLIVTQDDAGKQQIVMDGKWDMTGLNIIKTNKMGQVSSVAAKDYTIVFPSCSAGAGDYYIIITIVKAKVELTIPIKLIIA